VKILKKLLVVGLAASMSLVNIGCSNTTGTALSKSKVMTNKEIVATIEGVEIPESLYRIYLWSTQQFFEQISGTEIWEIDLDGRKTIDIAKERALESTILSVIVNKKAEELGLSLTKEEKENIEKSAIEFEEINTEICTTYGFNREDVAALLTATNLSQLVQEKISENYVPSEDDINEYVTTYAPYSEKVTAKHVLISTRDDQNNTLPETEVEEKRALAEDILARALAGEDMAELAKTYSEDPGSASTGGEYTFGRGEMVTEFEEASFNGVDGQVWPELVETSYGFHIIKTEAHVAADEEALREQYIENAKLEFANSELEDLIKSATVETTSAYEQVTIILPQEETTVEENGEK
jgi:foldase protein PrsA